MRVTSNVKIPMEKGKTGLLIFLDVYEIVNAFMVSHIWLIEQRPRFTQIQIQRSCLGSIHVLLCRCTTLIGSRSCFVIALIMVVDIETFYWTVAFAVIKKEAWKKENLFKSLYMFYIYKFVYLIIYNIPINIIRFVIVT